MMQTLRARLVLSGFALIAPTSAMSAITADDVCAPTANPCIVDGRVGVEAGAILDFGLRTLQIVRGGMLAAAASDVTVACGGLIVDPGGAIDFSGRGVIGSIELNASGRCQDSPTQPCMAASDCTTGTCTGGDVVLGGRLFGGGPIADPNLRIRAAGDIEVGGLVRMTSRSGPYPSPGSAVFEAGGHIWLDAIVRGRGKSGGDGADLILTAGGDVIVTGSRIDLRGGEYGGGYLQIESGNDVMLSGKFFMSAFSGPASGGGIAATAARDIVLHGQADGATTVFSRGNEGEDFPGDGGVIFFAAGRDVRVENQVLVDLSGPPSGLGGSITLRGRENVLFDARARLVANDYDGGGGRMQVEAIDGDITIGAGADVDLQGGSYGGHASFVAGGNASIAGVVTTHGKISTGSIWLFSQGTTSITGAMSCGANDLGFASHRITIGGCDVSIESGGSVSMSSDADGISVVARRSLSVDTLSSLVAEGEGTFIDLFTRSDTQPPSLPGTISPAPATTIDDSLEPCP
ncbi:MAG TPA: hypothetical protein VEL28_20910 [Candidatus Binatia bacterium]|nr:hypothetical protein [Candidatus Binatia bacterium]